jgi:type II secretory pathway component PulJ
MAEMLVALSLLGLVLAATAPALDQIVRAFGEGAARVETVQSARVALARLAHDVRAAGYGGSAADFAAVAVAEPSRIVLQSDLNGDAVIAGAGETIAWRVVAGVLRRDAGGGAQPVANGVRALAFAYLDADGRATATPAAVRAVRIELTAEPARPGSPAGAGIASTLATTVRLRNR